MADLIDEVRARVAALLDLDPGEVAEDAHLPDLGLDSVQLMEIETMLRDSGADVDIADLAEKQTLAAWRALLAR